MIIYWELCKYAIQSSLYIISGRATDFECGPGFAVLPAGGSTTIYPTSYPLSTIVPREHLYIGTLSITCCLLHMLQPAASNLIYMITTTHDLIGGGGGAIINLVYTFIVLVLVIHEYLR